MPRPFVVLADDEHEFRQQFVDSHPYDVQQVPNAEELLENLTRLRRSPDLVLLDIWRPPAGVDPADQERAEESAHAALDALSEQITKTHQAVQRAWEPRGYDILAKIRQRWPNPLDMPVALYTKRGLFIATNEQLELVEELNAHWVLKSSDAGAVRYETDRISRLIQYYRGQRASTLRLWAYRVVFSITTIALGLVVAGALDLDPTAQLIAALFGGAAGPVFSGVDAVLSRASRPLG